MKDSLKIKFSLDGKVAFGGSNIGKKCKEMVFSSQKFSLITLWIQLEEAISKEDF